MAKATTSFPAIIKSVSEKTGLPQARVKAIISEYLGTTMGAVAENQRVVIRGFGTFSKKERKPRKYRDVRTGEMKESSPVAVPSFQPSRVLLREMSEAAAPPTRPKKPTSASSERDVPKTDTSVRKVRSPRTEEAPACEIIISAPNPDQTDNLRIKYVPCKAFDSKDTYPIVYSPAPNALLKLPRTGRSNTKGYKEPDFLAEIQAALTDISISENFHLKIPGRYTPYEPDIVLYDEDLNLYIDVEIDEPYDGYSRLVTHIVEGRDAVRDVFFMESGWVVVRFTEKQVHLSSEQCISILRNVIDAMRGKARPAAHFIEEESRWNRRQAIQWERELYREKYLGIQFFPRQDRTRKVVCTDGVEGIDLNIQRSPALLPDKSEVMDKPRASVTAAPRIQAPSKPEAPATKPEPARSSSLAARKPSTLHFIEEKHTYASPGDLSGNSDRISVTTLIESFFPSFDEEKYIKKRMEETGMTEEEVRAELAEPSNRGTDMHKQIENYLKGLPYDGSSKEFQLFLRFHEEQIVRRGLVFDSAEYAIDLKGSDIAGTVDALFRKPDGDYVMVDWKRSKHLIIDGFPKKYGFGRGLSVLSHLDNSSYYKYELQQSFYKYILEKDYGIRVSSMILAVLHPDYDRYYPIKLAEYRKQEVLDMIDSYEKTL